MLATVASSTSANRIKRRLSEYGISSSVIQTPQALTKEGCGYSLRFDETSKRIVETTAVDLDIKIRAFYSEDISSGVKKYSKI